VHQVEHHVHRLADHARAARAAGWTLQETVEATAGEAERPVFERAGRPELFEQVRDTPLVLALSYRR
jgi:hypothetical protein